MHLKKKFVKSWCVKKSSSKDCKDVFLNQKLIISKPGKQLKKVCKPRANENTRENSNSRLAKIEKRVDS